MRMRQLMRAASCQCLRSASEGNVSLARSRNSGSSPPTPTPGSQPRPSSIGAPSAPSPCPSFLRCRRRGSRMPPRMIVCVHVYATKAIAVFRRSQCPQ
eukprot:1381798-Pyramimonas_sp.AAC.1